MKISPATIAVLRNFSSINQNLMVKAGSTVTTKTVSKNLFASANVDTVFPQDFGIYNTAQWLGILSLFSDPEIELSERSMTITQGKNKVQYLFASPDVLDFPEKPITMPATNASFVLSEENLKSLLKAGAVLSSTDLNIAGDGANITCTVLDPKNVSANTFSVEVGETHRVFSIFIKLENLKLISGTYNVSLSEKRIAQFENTSIEYSLFIANERNSSWQAE